jgi:hypothetical protein
MLSGAIRVSVKNRRSMFWTKIGRRRTSHVMYDDDIGGLVSKQKIGSLQYASIIFAHDAEQNQIA